MTQRMEAIVTRRVHRLAGLPVNCPGVRAHHPWQDKPSPARRPQPMPYYQFLGELEERARTAHKEGQP